MVAPGRGRGGATARWVRAGFTRRRGEMGGCCWAVGFTELGAREGNEWPNGGKASTSAGSITSGPELYWGFRFYDFCSVFECCVTLLGFPLLRFSVFECCNARIQIQLKTRHITCRN